MTASSPASGRLVRLNAICPYYTMFPLDFPLRVLADAKPGAWVLDPFCGRGTTLYAARLIGANSVGIDSNPVAVAASAAKLVTVKPELVTARAEAILEGPGAEDLPSGRFWELCFQSDVLDAVCKLRSALRTASRIIDVALRAVVLGALHGPRNQGPPSYLSNQMPRTYSTKPNAAVRFWERRDLRPEPIDVVAVLTRHATWRYEETPPPASGAVVEGEASEVLRRLRRRFDWVVTSPPYPGMVTYRPDQWLRNWFIGGPAAVGYGRDGQLGALTGPAFTRALADVWSAAAARCNPGAKLAVRFGALPSTKRGEPEDILAESLDLSGGWHLLELRSAGAPADGRRQADQFPGAGSRVAEVDCLARKRD
jgi:DNA methylase